MGWQSWLSGPLTQLPGGAELGWIWGLQLSTSCWTRLMVFAAFSMREFLAKSCEPCGISVNENESAPSWPCRSSPAANGPWPLICRNARLQARDSGSESEEYGRNE